jgi:hypothetical protein
MVDPGHHAQHVRTSKKCCSTVLLSLKDLERLLVFIEPTKPRINVSGFVDGSLHLGVLRRHSLADRDLH